MEDKEIDKVEWTWNNYLLFMDWQDGISNMMNIWSYNTEQLRIALNIVDEKLQKLIKSYKEDRTHIENILQQTDDEIEGLRKYVTTTLSEKVNQLQSRKRKQSNGF